jgi:hypothetical protein
MKIGLITVPFNNNYGGFLQAYALKTLLENRGHSVEIINRRRNRPGLKWRIRNFITSIIHHRQSYYSQQYKIKKISKNTNHFIKLYLSPITKPIYTSAELTKFVRKKDYDAYIIGSDQVWRYKFCPSNIDDYFGGFIPTECNTPKIAYAASFGTKEFEYNEEKRILCSKLLHTFTTISVREQSAKSLLISHFDASDLMINFVLDPTLVLDKEYYVGLINKNSKCPPQKGYLLSYILDKKEDVLIAENKICQSLSLRKEYIKAQTGPMKDWTELPPIEEWLSLIYYSDFVYTDSFHGMVFSIIFHKPFIAYVNRERGADRFSSLLSLLGLESRMIYNSDNIDNNLFCGIEWTKVEYQLERNRQNSIAYIDNSLRLLS